ncbi:MAG TPA: catalase [Nocardioidaceae bacterium]|nr:catalase [Nocardioidaceae bacterium]
MSDKPTNGNAPRATTDTGAPAPSHEITQSVGANGPLMLQDFHFVEHMAHFNRERVPERNVHAKGSGAFGYFETTEDVSQYTRAAMFQPGAKSEMLARFSTVAGEMGSADTARDPRGFALKFYTSEGNYDLVGNNTPIFFIRDTMKFPHFIRSQKRQPASGLQDFEMRWDFWTLNPESAHQVTYLMGDRGIPRSYRHMNGYGSHTYMWVNAQGERFWVKYHFECDQGVENLSSDEGSELAGNDPDVHRRDLFRSIEAGEFPSWTLYVQVIPYEEGLTYRYNIFDVTKVVPHGDYPLIKVGKMVLDRNPENHFAQIEQAAFEPSALVPGIGFSPDKMLQGRIFAYADTHRYRIGPNYHQLPVNSPKVEVASYNQDGPMRYGFRAGQPPYYPNTKEGPQVTDDPWADTVFDVSGEIVRQKQPLAKDDDDFSQARALLTQVMDADERTRLVDNVAGTLYGLTPGLKERVYDYWRAIDKETGDRIAAAAKDEDPKMPV